jgi:hypothetical protein
VSRPQAKTPTFGAGTTPERRVLFAEPAISDVVSQLVQLKADLRDMKAATKKKTAKLVFAQASNHYAEINFSSLDDTMVTRLTKVWNKIVQHYEMLVPPVAEPVLKRRKQA